VQEEAAVPADLVPDLADGLQERLRLDVPHRAAHLGDDHVDVGPAHLHDAGLDLVRDVGDDLDGVAQVVAAPLLGDDAGVDPAGGDVRRPGQPGIEEPLVVPDVQIGLRAVIGDKHLTVLEGVHGPRVHVEVRVELLHRYPEPARPEQASQAGSGEALAEAGGHAPSHKQMLGQCRA
jgi:hypothetical protein